VGQLMQAGELNVKARVGCNASPKPDHSPAIIPTFGSKVGTRTETGRTSARPGGRAAAIAFNDTIRPWQKYSSS
jgi:hypothetical protein